MATATDVRALDADCPWLRDDFQRDLALLRASTAEAARRFAADVRVLARLVAQVPRCPFDDRGATPWTSFRREVAVARSISDVAAAAEIRAAVRLTGPMPRTLALLEQGQVTVERARAFVREVEVYDDALVAQLDDRLADRVARLPRWRIVHEVRRAAAVLEPEAAALRTAQKDADRSVLLQPEADDQASVLISGPAVPLTRWHDALDGRARSLKQGGDPRTLAQLRFDLATSSGGDAAGAAGMRPNHVEAATDRRSTRPVQAHVTVPVETALGLSNEPGWLDGYGWLSAPTTRQLLVDAELRRVCTRSGTGELVDVAERDVRPPPDPAGVRAALLEMVLEPVDPSPVAWRVEDRHDPSPPLRELVAVRDRFCDGPTGARVSARRSNLDHDTPHPHGPTAAWNLRARSQRTHQLKHHGWTPLRTPISTLWFSPAGQVVEVPHHGAAPPGVDRDPDLDAVLPDPDELAALDAHQLAAPEEDLHPPWVPPGELRPPQVQWLPDAPPF